MNSTLRIIKDINTIFNGKDYCHSKVWSSIAFVSFITFSIYDLNRGSKFDPIAWGTGASTIILAGAAGARIKNDTEPQGVKDVTDN